MNTKTFSLGAGKILLSALLLAMFVPAAGAQHLTMVFPGQAQRVINSLFVTGPYGSSYFETDTNVAGSFNVSNTEFTPAYYPNISVACTALQNSTITATPTSLSVTGLVEISSSGSVFGLASASWSGLSDMFIGFTIDRSFTYSLQASTTMNTNVTETVPIAMVGISTNGDDASSLPNIVAYGSITYPGGAATAPSASGTSTGVFAAGTYYFIARAHSSCSMDPVNTPIAEHFLATFNLSVTYVPPQPPVIMAFTPNGAGAFNLIWNAPQTGNYRVLSSTNLTSWAELIPASARPSGPNTNLVGALPGSNLGFFRVEYDP